MHKVYELYNTVTETVDVLAWLTEEQAAYNNELLEQGNQNVRWVESEREIEYLTQIREQLF